MAAGDVNVKITTPRAFKGASFDGVDDYVEIPHHDSQLGDNLPNGFTISAWIYPKSKGEGDTFSDGRIIDKSDSLTAGNGFLYAIRGANNNVIFSINGATKVSSGNDSLIYKKWNHVLLTKLGIGNATHYINGVLSGTPGLTDGGVSAITTTNALRIGNRSTADDRTFDGLIKDVKMWNRVLTADEALQEYRTGSVRNADLILNVPLQTDYNDKSINALTGTNSGTSFVTQEDTFRNVLSGQLIINQLSGSYILSGQYMICGLAGGQICSVALQHT